MVVAVSAVGRESKSDSTEGQELLAEKSKSRDGKPWIADKRCAYFSSVGEMGFDARGEETFDAGEIGELVVAARASLVCCGAVIAV